MIPFKDQIIQEENQMRILKMIVGIIGVSMMSVQVFCLEKEIYLPKMLFSQVQQINNIDTYVSTHKNSEGDFKAGFYYFYQALESQDKHAQESNIKKAIQNLEKTVEAAPNDPLRLAMLGSAYGYQHQFIGFPFIIMAAQKTLSTFKKAVDLNNNNPEIRLFRLRVLVYYPYQFNQNLKPVILEDKEIVMNWINTFKANQKTIQNGDAYSTYFVQIQDEVNWLMGLYFVTQIKDIETAKIYISDIPKESAYYNRAQLLLKPSK